MYIILSLKTTPNPSKLGFRETILAHALACFVYSICWPASFIFFSARSLQKTFLIILLFFVDNQCSCILSASVELLLVVFTVILCISSLVLLMFVEFHLNFSVISMDFPQSRNYGKNWSHVQNENPLGLWQNDPKIFTVYPRFFFEIAMECIDFRLKQFIWNLKNP